MTRRPSLALAALCLILPQSIAAACLPEPVHQAAQVRELEVMLASVVIRCRTIQIELQPRYDQFRLRQKAALASASTAMKGYFQAAHPVNTRAATDRFQTRLANLYGAGRTDEEACALFGEVLDMLGSADAEQDLLEQISSTMIPEPVLAADECK
jgi:hypothetical protein